MEPFVFDASSRNLTQPEAGTGSVSFMAMGKFGVVTVKLTPQEALELASQLKREAFEAQLREEVAAATAEGF